MITITLGKLARTEAALARLSQMQLPMKAAYPAAKLVKLATPELQTYHEKRSGLFERLGDKRDATQADVAAGIAKVGETVTAIKPEHLEEFAKEMKELEAIEVSLAVNAIDVKLLESATISPGDLMVLEPFLTEEAPKAS